MKLNCIPKSKISRAVRVLEREFGIPVWTRKDPLDELMVTLLSQNTNDANRDLKLGTDTGFTINVILGRSGHLVEVTGGTIWLDAPHTFGLDLNEAGHNPGHPSIDVFISGAVEAYIDDQGIHNA